MKTGLWRQRGGDTRFRTCFVLAFILHGAVFAVGSLGLGTRVEYGMKGQVAMAGGTPRAKPPEEDTVSLEDAADEASPVKKKVKPTPAPTPQTTGTGGLAQTGVTDLPSYLKNPPPLYPEEARRTKQEGIVLIQVGVDAEGKVSQASVTRSSGYPLLDQAALETVGKWRFKPARMAGIAVSTTVDVPIRFQIENKGGSHD